mmetsp:Transcript_12781/g.18650  ORF Transcript_12781/g.18650 Transcript_12781/m.18650 type:complete len:152 (+) Transcript_12781:107-562(+)|eukprot:CAMPEP_0197239422 /NCGR_PEP_ID=MMETSP1429-20130617/5897_1 /TAXON_ID=49237 /ORGANISM="Chaetoceros  sp., Strain UNC1202" /LENGTH=151 /DNA_ID=CAMNT_0042698835 /DNA_START=63 /DNA_END=518 /DNA_ORIENTATION=+
MAKGIRSKIKRKHRSEFRNTIGQEAADKNMEKVQQKLQECISKGSLNSFERISNLLHGNDNDDNMEEDDDNKSNIDIDAMDTSNGNGKNPDKMVTKKPSKKKHVFPNVAGQSGAKLARQKVNKMKRRGKMKKGQVVRKIPTGRKKKGNVSF